MFRAIPLIAILIVCSCSKEPAQASSQSTAPAASSGSTASSVSAASAQAGAAPPADAVLQPPAAKPVPAQLPAVVARVNGEDVSKAEFDRAIVAIEARNGGPVPPAQRDRVLRGVLDQVVAYKILMQEAKARKVIIPESELDARMKEITSQFPNDEALKQTLASRKTTLEQVRQDVKQDMTVQKMIDDEITPKIAVKPEQVTDFYTKNPDQFKQPERVHASHILITVPKDADAAAKTQARTKAADVLKEVKAGKDFAALAKQYSQDPGSAPNGGDLGFFQQGQMVGAFNDMAFKLAPGQVSDLVETEFGFHIIKVAEKEPARTIPLEEVRPKLEEYLQRMNRDEQTNVFVNGLKSKGKIEILM